MVGRRVAIGFGAAALLGSGYVMGRGDAPAQARLPTPRGPLEADEQAHVQLFKRVSPSVVHITTTAAQRDFFSRQVFEVPAGTGSGFLWDEAGHVVTNFHVINGATGAKVTLADQSEYPARHVGSFPDRDLAVLRIELPADKLRAGFGPIHLGSSRELQVGQRVYAIGNPFGLDFTLTTGIVSALNREIESQTRRSIRGVIQTDAAINPGNSGGPLLDSAGRLIGVNTQIYSPSGASAGIGFAIPVDEVNRVVPRLIRDGRFIRPSLDIRPGNARLSRALNLPRGVPVVMVLEGSPAARAGLLAFRQRRDGGIEAGDVITAVGEVAVADWDDLLTELEKRQVGDSVRLTLWRAGRTRQLSVTLRAES